MKVVFAGASSGEQKLEITVDGDRVKLVTIGAGQRGGRGGKDAVVADADDAVPDYLHGGRAALSGKKLEVRIAVKAGPRVIGVAFIERKEVRDEEVLRPRLRSTGPELAVETVTISGPYNRKGLGDTPRRGNAFSYAGRSFRL